MQKITFDDYLKLLPSKKKLSDVKIKILETLWGEEDHNFPKKWVSSAELLKLTGQKYFDRRTRELRDQLGCDLESSYIQEVAGHAWRLKSSEISPPQNREYLTQVQKGNLFNTHNFTCATCGVITQAGLRGLQADHKVPISRGGSNDISNWQPLCINCNVGKRRSCEGCNLNCQECSWAFPERIGIKTMVMITEEHLRRLQVIASQNGSKINDLIQDAITHYLNKLK